VSGPVESDASIAVRCEQVPLPLVNDIMEGFAANVVEMRIRVDRQMPASRTKTVQVGNSWIIPRGVGNRAVSTDVYNAYRVVQIDAEIVRRPIRDSHYQLCMQVGRASLS
jgi:hypothetical protein